MQEGIEELDQLSKVFPRNSTQHISLGVLMELVCYSVFWVTQRTRCTRFRPSPWRVRTQQRVSFGLRCAAFLRYYWFSSLAFRSLTKLLRSQRCSRAATTLQP